MPSSLSHMSIVSVRATSTRPPTVSCGQSRVSRLVVLFQVSWRGVPSTSTITTLNFWVPLMMETLQPRGLVRPGL